MSRVRIFKEEGGFSILEALIAVSILSIGIVGLLQAYGQGLRSSRMSRDRLVAISLAQQKMAEFEADPSSLSSGIQEGDFGEEFRDYRWEADIEKGSVDGLYHVTIRVIWGLGGQENSWEMIAYMVNLSEIAQPSRTIQGTSATGGGR